MSRTKNAYKQAELEGLPLAGKMQKLRHGLTADFAAQAAIKALHDALYARTEPACQRLDDQAFAKNRDTFWKYVAENYSNAWSKHDGSFFRTLADAMETSQRPNDLALSLVGGEIQWRQARKLPMPTNSEMREILERSRVPVDRKTVSDAFRFFKVKPAPGKRGAPTGTRQNSVHRRRR